MGQVRAPVLRLHVDELIVDNFAGGGGASVGMEWALGRSPDIAKALSLHQRQVDTMLAEPREDGTLITCDVTLAGGKKVIEYRCSESGPIKHPLKAWRPKEVPMGSKPTVIERAIAALKEHGPCTLEQLAKHIGSTAGSLTTISRAMQARGVVKHHRNGTSQPAVYSWPKAAIPVFAEQKPDALKAGAELGKVTPPKGHGPAAQSRSRNGSGDAEVPAAGPALSGALKALRDERASLLDKAEKLERAIEAIEALA